MPRVDEIHRLFSAQFRASAVAENAPSSCLDTLLVSSGTRIRVISRKFFLATDDVGASCCARSEFTSGDLGGSPFSFQGETAAMLVLANQSKLLTSQPRRLIFWESSILGELGLEALPRQQSCLSKYP